MDTLKLALVADIHHGPNSYSKRSDRALDLLEMFVEEVNKRKPDLVVDLGDRISDVNQDEDWRLERQVATLFDQLTVPHVHLLGNHDLEHLSREDNAATLEQSVDHQSLDMKGYHLVFWQPDAYFPEGFVATEAQLEWLAQDLESTALPTLIFTHAPFSGSSMTGNYYFENAPKHWAGYQNAGEIRNLIQEKGHVVACISGHVHWNSLDTVMGVHHLTLQSLTESFTTQGKAAGSWGWLELSSRLDLEVFGNDPFEVRLPLRKKSEDWLQPLEWQAH